MFSRFLFALATATTVLCAVSSVVAAQSATSPSGDVILTMTGPLQTDGTQHVVEFDREGLAALGLETIETETIWTEGVQVFEGVSLATLVALMEAEDGVMKATAINDYSIEIPVSDAVENGPIVAIRLNGEDMRVRDKGPLWVVYPYDASDAYRTEVIYSRSIWQLDRIEFVK